MQILQFIIIGLYTFFILFVLFYSFSQLALIFNYLAYRRKVKKGTITEDVYDVKELSDNPPMVTVQLPVFNEKYVVERLIDTVAAIKYPKEFLEIQVLDDSTDETVDIVAKKVEYYKNQGYDIVQFRRENRKGFKAGALQEGMEICKGEFIAIFDSDFVPSPDFLIRTLPYFKQPKVGVVQTKWTHLNEDYSLLTKLQAFGLDAHFTVEQSGRNYGGHFINFNGTAGIWRKECIYDAGGWSSDTLTEDLDLSYRAQVKHWKFKYLEELESPAELPAAIQSLKAQQFRWSKGAAECTMKNMVRVFKATGFSLKTKVFALFHLMNSFLFICILALSLLSVPLIVIKEQMPELKWLFQLGGIFLVSLVILFNFYWVAAKRNGRSFGEFMFLFPAFLSVSMGLSVNNAKAVLEGYVGKKSAFIRTPKFNLVKNTDNWINNKYIHGKLDFDLIMEGLLTVYFIGGIALGVYYHDFGLLPFHIMLVFGFATVFNYSMRQAFNVRSDKTKISNTPVPPSVNDSLEDNETTAKVKIVSQASKVHH